MSLKEDRSFNEMFSQLKNMIQEISQKLEESQQEISQKIQKLEKSQQEISQKIQKLEKSQQEISQKLEESQQEIKREVKNLQMELDILSARNEAIFDIIKLRRQNGIPEQTYFGEEISVGTGLNTKKKKWVNNPYW